VLTSELESGGIYVEGLSFLKQVRPRNLNLFMYCFIISLGLNTPEQKV